MTKQIKKRDGKVVEFQPHKIDIAISKALGETNETIRHALYSEMIDAISGEVQNGMDVEKVQDIVEKQMMVYGLYETAKAYILYRQRRSTEREKEQDDTKYGLLSKSFLSNYKHAKSPMTSLGSLVYYRTYSRYLPELGRREYWWETVRRVVEYSCSLLPTTVEEAEKLYDNMFNLRQFVSGRSMWVGGTSVADKFPMANYNCSAQIMNEYSAFTELFYLLMIGSGVGVRILKEDVAEMPALRTGVNIVHKKYSPVPKNQRVEYTSLNFDKNGIVEITVGDSKEGWVQALDFLFSLLWEAQYRNVKNILINYDNVRPKGEPLKTFGGTASGHSALSTIFEKIDKIVKKYSSEPTHKLKSIDVLDFCNIIGEGVVVGGVRRTAEIILMDSDDKECIEAKSKLYTQSNGKWVVNKDILHRQMSNNSIFYKEKPSREMLHWQIEQMRYSGEPAWINQVAGKKRRKDFNAVNPCSEILLDNKGLCNLTTINVFAFVDEDGQLDMLGLLEAQRLSARASYRMTCVDLELPNWDKVQKRDKLLGCSLTGWQDMVNATKMTREEQAELLKALRKVANDSMREYAKANNMNESLLVTTLKPEGSISQLPTVSSGIHYSHSPYYIRRVRINAHDPLVEVCKELGLTIHPEVGQTWDDCTTVVVEFYVKAPEGTTKYNVGAIEQLENYKMFMENYVDHNASITVHVRGDKEWEEVEQWVWDNWDDTVAVSFLDLDDNFYDLMPYEKITKEQYDEKMELMKKAIITPDKIAKYEKLYKEFDIIDTECESGVCPIR